MDTLYLQNKKAINEIKYFVMFFAIKRLLEQEKITLEISDWSILLLPKNTAFCRSIFSGCCNSYSWWVVVSVVWDKKDVQSERSEKVPQVKVIQPLSEQSKKLRVAAYARVSSRFSRPVELLCHPSWLLHRLYPIQRWMGVRRFIRRWSDIRHNSRQTRDFQRLLVDCHAGKIDRILVKSVTPFARNTLDCIQTVRELKQLNIPVEFEKENIDIRKHGQRDAAECFGSAAQEESSLSRKI